jgi:hypothetical protein
MKSLFIAFLLSASLAAASTGISFAAGDKAEIGKEYVTVNMEWAAVSKDMFDLVRKNIADKAAMEGYFRNGTAVKLKTGLKVTLKSMPRNDVVELRPVGKNFSFWTFPEAIGLSREK